MDIKSKIIELNIFQLGTSDDPIELTDRFIEDLGADSLDTIELWMAIEEEFCIDVDDNLARADMTIGDAV